MKEGQCPGCGAPVDFQPGQGKIKVCEYCNTVLLRGEANLESLGKVAELTDTGSPLKLKLNGRYSGNPFTVAGRIQKRNRTGTWDEWCLSFEDGRTGWLSESEGEWNFMYPMEGVAVPNVNDLAPMASFTLRDKRFVVEEKNHAETVSASGQLPEFNKNHLYVDATGPRGIFCSLDYAGGSGEAFVGSRVTLEQMGFSKSDLTISKSRQSLTGAKCTQCGGMLSLKAPDSTRRVACPYCGALLDVAHGKLSFLQLLEKPPTEPALPLGATGTLLGTEWTVLAYLIRSATVEGTRYPWDEYLLWNREKGFVWLMQANGHWTFLRPIPAGDVAVSGHVCVYEGKSYKAYQTTFCRTDYVLGECYWTVSVGELARGTEFISPPKSVNVDLTETEVTFTAGELVPAADVEAAFKPAAPLPAPTGIAPAMQNPFLEKASSAWAWSAVWGAALLVVVGVFTFLGSSSTYFNGTFSVPPSATPGSPEAQRFSEPFEVPRNVALAVEVSTPDLTNTWAGVSVDLVNTQSGEVIAVYTESSYYEGVDDGERWTEGSRSDTKQTAEVDRGFYVMRVTPHYDPGKPVDFKVLVRADDGPGFCCPCSIFLLLLLVPFYYQLRSSGFETERWNESVFQSTPGEGSETSDDDDDEDGDDDDE